MKRSGVLLIVFVIMLVFSSLAFAVPTIDVQEFPNSGTTYFQDPAASVGSDPYYRWHDEDWGWQHDAISGTITSATINISAWDVDWANGSDPERDIVWVEDNGTLVNLGYLTGEDSTWSYSTITLGSNFYDDIATGLKIWIDIDSTHTYDNWAVTIAKSSLSVDGGIIPNPNPGSTVPSTSVPEPATFLLFGAGLAGVGLLKKKFMN
jgi:hypothetical protein